MKKYINKINSFMIEVFVINFVISFLGIIYLIKYFNVFKLLFLLLFIGAVNFTIFKSRKSLVKQNQEFAYKTYLEYMILALLNDRFDFDIFLKEHNITEKLMFDIFEDKIIIMNSSAIKNNLNELSSCKSHKKIESINKLVKQDYEAISSKLSNYKVKETAFLPYLYSFSYLFGFIISVIYTFNS